MNNRQTAPARLPVTSHHLFPPALALWFGALFGFSCLAVRISLCEKLVLASHLDSIFPFAAPPLGHLAHGLLALGFAVVGMGLGLVVARIVVSLNAPAPEYHPQFARKSPETNSFRVRARDAHPDAPARRPVSARDELAHAAPIAMPKLWMADAAPTAAVSPATIADVDEPVSGQGDHRADLTEPALATASSEHQADPDTLPQAEPLGEFAEPPVPPSTAAERIARAHPSELSPVELIERLAIAMHRRTASDMAEPAGDAAHPHRDERIAAIESLRDSLVSLRGGAG